MLPSTLHPTSPPSQTALPTSYLAPLANGPPYILPRPPRKRTSLHPTSPPSQTARADRRCAIALATPALLFFLRRAGYELCPDESLDRREGGASFSEIQLLRSADGQIDGPSSGSSALQLHVAAGPRAARAARAARAPVGLLLGGRERVAPANRRAGAAWPAPNGASDGPEWPPVNVNGGAGRPPREAPRASWWASGSREKPGEASRSHVRTCPNATELAAAVSR